MLETNGPVMFQDTAGHWFSHLGHWVAQNDAAIAPKDGAIAFSADGEVVATQSASIASTGAFCQHQTASPNSGLCNLLESSFRSAYCYQFFTNFRCKIVLFAKKFEDCSLLFNRKIAHSGHSKK